MNNSNNQNWLQKNSFLVVFLVTVFYILLIGTSLQAYQVAKKIELEFENLDTLEIAIQDAEIDEDKLDVLLTTAIELTAIEDRALGYLGIFEAIGFAFTIFGALLSAIILVAGLRYDDTMKQMNNAIQRMNVIDSQFEERHRLLRESGLAQSLMTLAEKQYKARDIDGALQTYEQALQLDENNPVVYYYIGYLQTHKNLLNQARDTLLKAMELEPLSQIQAALGYAYRRIGDEAENRKDFIRRDEFYDLANKYLSEALETSPRLVDVDGESWYGSLAGLHKRRGNLGDNETPEEERRHLEQARYYYGEAAKVTPLSSYPQFNIAMITMRLEESVEAAKGEFEKTKKLIDEELQASHDNHWYRANLLLTNIALQEFDEMAAAVDILNQLIPPHAKDVKPRIVEDIRLIQQILKKANIDTTPIDTIIQQLNGSI